MRNEKRWSINGFRTAGIRIVTFLVGLYMIMPAGVNAQTVNWVRQSDMLTPRTHFAVAQANGMVYAAGGYYGEYLNSAEVLNSINNTWSSIADMPVAREGHGAVGINS